jgi:hypothetical protein
MVVKLSLGCFGLIKPEVDLIHTILRTSSRLDDRWEVTDEDECDAIVLYHQSHSFSPLKLKPNTQFIYIKKRGETHVGHAFYRPFRADELIDVLLLIQSAVDANVSAPATQPSTPKKTYKLKKWPTADILAIDKNYTLLSVYLSRSKKTLQDLIVLSGKTEEFCVKFITLLESKELLHSEIIPMSKILNFENPIEDTSKKKTFFSQLRDKLGINRNH